MSLIRRAAKRDTSEKAIVEYLRKAGWSVLHLSVKDGPDLVVGKYGLANLFIECKSGKKKLQPGQQSWADEWRGDKPYVLRTVEDAMALNRAVGPLAGLSIQKGAKVRYVTEV